MKISLNGKEYESGKITREKYKKFAAVYESLLGKEKEAQTFSDEDLDKMVEAIVLVYGNQFTFDEANDGLDEISSIILNFSLINAEIMNKTNLQAEAVAKTLKTNVITIAGKEYESGKIGRKKYKAFREVYNDLVTPEKQTYTDEELDRMVSAIVEIYDNQFTFEEVNEELADVSQIIFNFALINANIIKRLGEQAEDAKKKFEFTRLIDTCIKCGGRLKRFYSITTYAYRRYIQLMELISRTEDENDLLYLYSAVIRVIFNDRIEEEEIEQLDVAEIVNTFQAITEIVDASVNEKIRGISEMLSGSTQVEDQGSAFDEYDRENGYIEEHTQEEAWESYKNALDNILQICIKNMRNSYKDCLESDLSDLLSYVVFQVEYDRETQAKE